MANQAIALQARAPQGSILGGAIQRNAQMMNMMSQQRAAERQAAAQQQQMELARAAEGRAVTAEEREARKAQQEYMVGRVAYFRDQLPSVKDDVSWNNWLGRVGQEDPEYADELRRASGGRYDADFVNRVSMDAKTFIDKTIATPTASFQVGKDLETYSATVGGTQPGVTPLIVGGATPTQTPTAPAQTPMSAPATDAQIDEAARKIIGGAGVGELGISVEDFDRASERANQMTAGGGARMQPISMTTGAQMGGQPDMTAVVQDMMSSGQISQSNLQLMREMAGPDKDAQLAQILKANNIQIVPDAQPQMRSAVFRPGEDAAPQMQLAQATNAPGTQFRVAKDPTQSPTPGVYSVPTPVIRDVKAAETQGSEGVRVQTQPTITAKEERIRRVEKLRGELPVAKNATGSLIADIDDRIDTIDRLLSNKYRFSIVGPIEGNLPRLFQVGVRADVQADFDKIKNTATLTELTKLKTSTETGGSPLGSNPTDRDAKIVETAASALIQTGEPAKFDEELKALRRKLYRMRTTAVTTYNDTFREVLPEDPRMKLQVRPISPVYRGAPETRTSTRRAAPQQGWGRAEVVGD
jgi:hypothetical protein